MHVSPAIQDYGCQQSFGDSVDYVSAVLLLSKRLQVCENYYCAGSIELFKQFASKHTCLALLLYYYTSASCQRNGHPTQWLVCRCSLVAQSTHNLALLQHVNKFHQNIHSDFLLVALCSLLSGVLLPSECVEW